MFAGTARRVRKPCRFAGRRGCNRRARRINVRNRCLPTTPSCSRRGKVRSTRLPPPQLYDRACQQGWADGCSRLAGIYFLGTGVARDVPRAITALERACALKSLAACADLGVMLQEGDGVPADAEKGRTYLKRACDGGVRSACDRLEGRGAGN